MSNEPETTEPDSDARVDRSSIYRDAIQTDEDRMPFYESKDYKYAARLVLVFRVGLSIGTLGLAYLAYQDSLPLILVVPSIVVNILLVSVVLKLPEDWNW